MPDDTDILGLPLILPAQAQKHVTHNEALLALDVIVQLAVISRDQTVPPALAAVGDRHIVPAAATLDWAGQAGKIAVMTETGWQFHAPNPGWAAQVLTEGQVAVYDGLGWVVPSESDGRFARLGVSAAPDATNRLTVSAPATLLNHAGAGHQLKLNKATASDTASLLFQTGFSGRAEMGTAGSDAFAVKVSADGSAWSTALSAAPASGEVTLPAPLHLGGQAADPASPPDGTIWLNTTTGEVKLRTGGVTVAAGSGGGITDGDKGDITVSGGGASWTIDAGAVALGKLANVASGTLYYRKSAGTGAPEVQTLATLKTDLGLTGTNSGDQTITLTGEVTGSGTGSFAASIAADAVTNAKLANMPAATLKGNSTGAAADPADLTVAQVKTLLAYTPADIGAQAADGDLSALAALSGTNTIYYRSAADTWSPVTIGANLTFTGGTLAATGGGGGVPDGDKGDITTSSSGTVWTVDAGAITLAKLADLASGTILGRATAGTGVPEALTAAQVRTLLNVADGANAYVHPDHSGDVTSTGDGATVIAADAVTNAKLANMASARLKGRVTAGSGDPEDLTGTQVTALLDTFGSAAKGLTPASGGGTVNFLRADGTWASPGGSLPTLSPWDFWTECRFGSSTATSPDHFMGAAISSGTNSTALPAGAGQGIHPVGVYLRSSTTANGGYRYVTASQTSDYFGVVSHRFRACLQWKTDFTGRLVRLGFLDIITSADATDGAYFQITGADCAAKTANNAVRTTHATTLTLALDTIYTFDVEVDAGATSARFRVYEGLNTTPQMDVTITTNIPTGSARGFGSGLVATEASTVASDMVILHMLGSGTVAGYQRATGDLT